MAARLLPRRRCIATAALLGFAVCCGLVAKPQRSLAQSTCTVSAGAPPSAGGTQAFACGSGAIAPGNNATAIGTNAGAVGDRATAVGFGAGLATAGTNNTAIGFLAGADVTGNRNTASGSDAGQTVQGNANTATGFSAGQFVTGDSNVAIGNGAGSGTFGNRLLISNTVAIGNTAVASANDGVAIGNQAQATGANAVALGSGAQATGTGSIAIGQGAVAAGSIAVGTNAQADNGGTAIGDNTVATQANSAAFGEGATASRANQQAFGTAANTYTMAGIASAASRSAQGAPTHFVMSNAGGDLAAFTPAELGLATAGDLNVINARLGEIDSVASKALTGVAMAFAMAGVPNLMPHEKFALAVNYGTFQGRHGVAFNTALKLHDNVQLTAGVGYGANERLVGGRAGLRFGW